MGTQPSCQVLLCAPLEKKEPTQPREAPVPLGPLGETCCEQHGEKISFFCGIDAELLCVVCREGPSHRTHPVALLDGAVQPYRDRLGGQWRALRLQEEEMEDTRRREDRKLQDLLMHIESKRRQVDAEFGRLQRELADQHCLLQARLRELEQQVRVERAQYNSKLSEEIARLGAQAQGLEEWSRWPASVLLQDIRAKQSRSETKTFVSPETVSLDLVRKTRDLHRKVLSLPALLRTFSEHLAHHLETDSGADPLDPRTASRSLALADDRKPARLTRDEQDLTHSPLRSEGVPDARGTPGCPSGRHRGQVPPAARGEAAGVAGVAGVAGEGAGLERRPAAPAPAAPGAPLPRCALPPGGTPPLSPASPHTPLLRRLEDRFLPA